GRTRWARIGLDAIATTGRRRRRLRWSVAFDVRDIVNADDKIADVDLVGVFDDERARDLATVDVRAVRALEIDDDELAVFEHDARVTLRHVALRQHDVVPLNAAYRDLRLVEHHAALFAAFFLDDDG